MGTAVEIHELTKANAGLLNNLAPDVFDAAIDPRHLASFLEDPRHVMLLAVEDRLVVGMGSGVAYFHPDKYPQMFINEVGVASPHRRCGIGNNLTAALIRTAKARGCVYAWLGTAEDNAPAQGCFASVLGAELAQKFLLYEWDLED